MSRSARDGAPAAAPLHEFGPLPRDAEGPVFAEPWQAQAFALTVQLHGAGHFTWQEWAAYLAAEIGADDAAGAAAGAGATNEHYYRCWLRALEKLLHAKGLVEERERAERQDAWDRAARSTPHGQPIDLANA